MPKFVSIQHFVISAQMGWEALSARDLEQRSYKRLIVKKYSKFIISLMFALYWVGCAPKHFSKDEAVNRCQNFSEVCISSSGRDSFDYSVQAKGGLVDILLVDDNSASMSFEQTHMAERFSSFLSQLDSRSVDYRIGITTSDISSNVTASTVDKYPTSTQYNEPRAINKSGALQDGNLISFPDGSSFLTPSSASKEVQFQQTVQRPETKQCENFLKQYPTSQPPELGLHTNCPSDDERAIFAANLTVSKNPASFIRPNAHLAVVILSDEDSRSALYLNPAATNFQLEDNDQPSTLVNRVKANYPGKSMSVHSIIVRPGDQACVYAQSIQMGPASLSPTYGVTFNYMLGTEGKKYAEATALTNGILGDVCANDYGSQLATIGANIVERISDVSLACASPADLTVTLSPAQNQITSTVTGRNLHFSEALPAGTQARLKYTCPTL